MARITSEQRQKNKRTYDAMIVDLFLEEGWKSITYDRLTKELGLPRKSSLQAYYPSSAHFIEALRGKMFPMAAECLDFSSYDKFVDSWTSALEQHRVFRELVMMMVNHMVSNPDSDLGMIGYTRFFDRLEGNLGKDAAQDAIEKVLGITVLQFMKVQS